MGGQYPMGIYPLPSLATRLYFCTCMQSRVGGVARLVLMEGLVLSVSLASRHLELA